MYSLSHAPVNFSCIQFLNCNLLVKYGAHVACIVYKAISRWRKMWRELPLTLVFLVGLVLGKGGYQGYAPPLVLQGDFEIRAGKKGTKGTNSKCCSHTWLDFFKANYTLTCCAFRSRLIPSPRAVSCHLCVCRADSWSRYFTLYVQRSINGVVDILENTYLLMSIFFLNLWSNMFSYNYFAKLEKWSWFKSI